MTDSPTILFVLRAPIGGLFRHVVDLSAELEARGYKTGAVADSVTGAEAAETIARLDAALTHGVLLTPMPRLPGSKDMSALSAVAARARAIGAEVIHGHGAKGGLYARLAARRTGAKSVYTPHGGSLHYRWSRPSGMAFLGAERLLMGLTDAFIFESAYGKRAFEAKVGRPSCHTAVVPNGLMPGEFEPCTSVPEAEMADIGFVGELREIKGIDILLESLRELKSESGAPATLVIAGSGPDGDALKALTRSMGLEGRVRFLGRQPAREVFARSRVIAVPSR
ncbi:MAG: glycosyltransferase family 4 protein, partial [Hyphomicrobiaceae bacterium]|nr:glycosyltransferase family 4 protein [Hyphomicrobiaceae bacterium]